MNTRRVWYSSKVDPNSPDTIHQILMFGTLAEIKSLKKTMGIEKVRNLFLNYPKKVYTSSAFYFIKNFILRITTQLDEKTYLKDTPRRIG